MGKLISCIILLAWAMLASQIQALSDGGLSREVDLTIFDLFEEQNPIGCVFCKTQIENLNLFVNIPLINDLAALLVVEFCPYFPASLIANQTMCPGTIY